MQKQRNYQKEYQRRIERGLAAGKSRSAARGHPRAVDLPTAPPSSIDRNDPREKALKAMRQGLNQRDAAKLASVSEEQLRRYRLQNTASKRSKRRWIIEDARPQAFFIVTDGQMRTATLRNDLGVTVSAYWSSVNQFLASNDAKYLAPWIGKTLRDVSGHTWTFETRPNVLRRLDSVGELHFLEIYANVVQ